MSKKAMAKIVEINKQELSTEKVELGAVQDLSLIHISEPTRPY